MPGTPAGTAGAATGLSPPRPGSTHSCPPTGRTGSRADEGTGLCPQADRLSGARPAFRVVPVPAFRLSVCCQDHNAADLGPLASGRCLA